MTYDPVLHATNGHRLLQPDGAPPNFHDAAIHRLLFDSGDVRPDDNVWIGPWIVMDMEMCAEEHAKRIVLKFHDCDGIRLPAFNNCNVINDLHFSLRPRGFFADGKTPLPPYIDVRLDPGYGIQFEISCMKIEILDGWPAA